MGAIRAVYRQWCSGPPRVNPKKYGDKIETEHGSLKIEEEGQGRPLMDLARRLTYVFNELLAAKARQQAQLIEAELSDGSAT